MNGRKIVAFAMNLNDAPFPPYQLLNIEHGPFPHLKAADEAVKAAAETLGKALTQEVEDIRAGAEADTQFVTGDFNEPSGRDWAHRAVGAKHQPMVVEWPFTKGIEAEGLVDSFRAIYPDEVAKPRVTWAPANAANDPTDHHDRMDFILVRGKTAKVVGAGIVGEKAPRPIWSSPHGRRTIAPPWPGCLSENRRCAGSHPRAATSLAGPTARLRLATCDNAALVVDPGGP